MSTIDGAKDGHEADAPHDNPTLRTIRLDTVERALEDIAAGKAVVVVDDEHRTPSHDCVPSVPAPLDVDRLHARPRLHSDPGGPARTGRWLHLHAFFAGQDARKRLRAAVFTRSPRAG